MHRKLSQESINAITQKPVDFCAIWDLFGDFSLAMKRLQHAFHSGLKLWESSLVFMGDIIGDRSDEWLQILSHINTIREDILTDKKETTVQFIIGNHDLWALMFFASAKDVRKNPENITYRESRIKFFTELFYWEDEKRHCQWQGMTEFLDFLPMGSWDFDSFDSDLIRHLFLNGPEIIANMDCLDFGRAAVEELKKSKLCHQIEKTLFIHTPPTKRAIKFLEERNFDIEGINATWQKHVQNIFSEGSNEEDSIPYFELIAETFLDVNNRFKNESYHPRYGVFSEEQATKMKSAQIEKIVFWHDKTEEWHIQSIHGIELIGVDYGRTSPNAYIQKKTEKNTIFDRMIRIIDG